MGGVAICRANLLRRGRGPRSGALRSQARLSRWAWGTRARLLSLHPTVPLSAAGSSLEEELGTWRRSQAAAGSGNTILQDKSQPRRNPCSRASRRLPERPYGTEADPVCGAGGAGHHQCGGQVPRGGHGQQVGAPGPLENPRGRCSPVFVLGGQDYRAAEPGAPMTSDPNLGK